jgi:hypothetical protein
MRLVLKALPVASRFEAQHPTQHAHGAILRRFVFLAGAFKHADVEVVVGVAAAGVGDFVARLGAALGILRILLGIRAGAADDLDGDAYGGRMVHQRGP